jgi:hypothetical protein
MGASCCLFCGARAFGEDKVGNSEEEGSKREMEGGESALGDSKSGEGLTGISNDGAAPPPIAKDGDDADAVSDHDSSPAEAGQNSDGEEKQKSEPTSAPEGGLGWGDSGGDAKPAKPDSPAAGGVVDRLPEAVQKPMREAPGGDGAGPEIVECEPVRIICAVGAKTNIALPFTRSLWGRRRYEARFEPEFPEVWVSTAKGWIEPGARELPFTIFFRPSGLQTLESKLIVSLSDFETHTKITAATDTAPAAKHHHHHRE